MRYELYAIASNGKEYTRKINRKNEMSEESKEKVSGTFADYICHKYHVNVALYGCNDYEE